MLRREICSNRNPEINRRHARGARDARSSRRAAAAEPTRRARGTPPEPAPRDDDAAAAEAGAPAPDDDSCADIGEKCKVEGDCCEAPPRSCYLFKGKDKGKCFEECPNDKKYACYEDGPAPVPRYSPTKKPTKPSGGGGGRYAPTYKPTRGSD